MNEAGSRSKRDPRIDVLRGMALLMIFVDHVPSDLLNRVTLHAYGFADAAEVFVLLAGFSSMLAYGRSFERDGAVVGLRRLALRCLRIYVFQIGLLLTTLGVVLVWTGHFHFQPVAVASILGRPVAGIAHGLTLRALPNYLNILPLYIVLLAAFPLIFLALRRGTWTALGASGAVWLLASLDHRLNLPNWIDGQGWYFDPFAWQFLFTIGAALAVVTAGRGGALPYRRWAAALCAAFLLVAFAEAAPYADWGLPNLQPVAMAMPNKSFLAWPRILDILALTYLVLSSARVRRLAAHPLLHPVEACGRHSLEVFSVGCVLALFGRLAFHTVGADPATQVAMQVLVNAVGIGTMCLVALWLERGREGRARERVCAAR